MDEKYNVWRINYRFDALAIDGRHKMCESYVIIEKTTKLALKKADKLFSYSTLNKKLIDQGSAHGNGVSLSNLRKHISKYRIGLLRLKIDLDADKFSLEAIISNDEQYLEFIATKK